MHKNYYLQYFRKNQSKTNQTQQSFDDSWTSNDKINFSPIEFSGLCSTNTEQADPLDSPFSEITNCGQQKNPPKILYFKENSPKSHVMKNIRTHNNSSQMFKKTRETEQNEHPHSKIASNFRKNFSLINSNAFNSQQLKAVKFSTPTQQNGNQKNQSQFEFQRIKTLEAPNILENEKLFTQPIKPYDRNKTARNKKFKTLKTAFGDLNSSCRNYNDEYTMSLQNLRMGWRIVNTKSMIQEYLNSTYFTYHLYNGNMINKEKNKEAVQRQKKKINLKQMKNVYKVFFNQNIMFNKKQNKNPKIFESIKKKDQVHDYILCQSQMKVKSQSDSFMTPDEPQKSNTLDHVSPNQKYRIQRPRGSHKTKPCFIRDTYHQNDQTKNTKICEQSKYQKLSKSLYCKPSTSPQKSDNEPSRISMEEDHFQMNEIFGKGNTIIQLRDLQIEASSSIKKDDLLVLELMAQNGTINLKNGTMSAPIKYSQIKNRVKFAIDSKVGDFVPLKICKYYGINLVEIGIIDLNLIVFRNRKKYFDMENKIQSEPWSDGIQDIQLFRQERQSVTKKNRKQEREILYYHIRQKLRKNKKMQIQVTVFLNCLIYNRKFSRLKTNFTDDSQKENLFAQDPNEDNDLQ